MILDDIFEAMKPSDIPTVMRTNRLTMRDIEKERPQGAYRFRVGDNEFMDLDAAREFARGTGETVKPIRETVKKKLEDQQVNNLDEIENPFQQPEPIRTTDPMPPAVDPDVPPQYANYQSRRARAMANYAPVAPAAASAPAAAAEPQDTDKGVNFGRMVSQLAAPQGTATSTGGRVQPTSTGMIHRAARPAPASGTQTLARSDRPAWLGKPITMGDQVIKPTDPNYKKIADALLKQGITEKKKPVPTNKPLWGRAKAAARAKFDVYPSAYANAWAAKWYKSHGGGWRMGKGAKK
jgi:hypothetical protein